MKYDGWCLRYPEAWGAVLDKGSFARTRSELWDGYIGPKMHWQTSSRDQEIARYRRMGFVLVKVRIEVAE